MRVAIASRIFEPEPAAASFRLGALAAALAAAQHEVTVLTVRPSGGIETHDRARPYRVKRFPVLRDRTGYVRGYLQYLSFDVPLFLRILFGRKHDAIVAEPPPTTGFFVRLAAGLRRTPYFYYGADVWSDAAESAGAARPVVSAVRGMERFALGGARGVFSVNEGVTARLTEIAPRARVRTVGNGVDTEVFTPDGPALGRGRFAVYTGTTSEWQGAEVFVRAVAELRSREPGLRLVFIGQGSARPALRALAAELAAPVDFVDPVPAAEAAAWIRGAAVSLASIRPGAGYDFAMPTKMFASWATGTPTLFAGNEGPATALLREHPGLGRGVPHDVAAVAAALSDVSRPSADTAKKAEIADWARAHVSLAGVAEKAVRFIEERTGRRTEEVRA